ncbi:MAG: 30S ribosomal protein S27e [Candidatus Thermoplasmatota archaeon]|nr:30S ribosomal protein S27e [Candidatus Thermoplasmatota archaeon]
MTEKKKFVRIKCSDCENEQITFRHVSSKVECMVCGAPLAEPTGGYSEFNGEIVEELGVSEEGE